ncbi:alkylated DNA repair protein AlkB homolog 8 [Tanacetum coccineum]|uniref:Alkylated DNA repair protein AlkB homolog 8 n=1 Tax=Tanacetum coccineum TaxID=301880 RepID=A0ABQ5G867_9ASTR
MDAIGDLHQMDCKKHPRSKTNQVLLYTAGPTGPALNAKCGLAVGLTLDFIASTFSLYRTVKRVYLADERGCRVIVSYDDETTAQTILNALDRKPCSHLGGRSLHVHYSVQRLMSGRGVLASVDVGPWHNLVKRRVQHYGYEFCYNVSS